jgi:RNA polymerase sigma-70 factor (ECF subfamily)
MKISYEFVTGEVSEVEVDERLGGMLLDLDRQQYNNDQKETRRHFSLNGLDYEGDLFASAEDTEREAEHREDMARLYSAMEALFPSQRELMKKVYFEERKITDIAAEEGVDKSAISHRLERIHKKLKKIPPVRLDFIAIPQN